MRPGEARGPGAVRVEVKDHEGQNLPQAVVSLKGDTAMVELSYDEWSHSFASDKVPPGEYLLTGQAEGLQSESHQVRVGPTGLSDTLILGTKGLPFYYLGAVKVPFDPPVDLIGLTLDPRNKKADALLRQISKDLGLEYVEVPDAVTADNVRVLKSKKQALEPILKRLTALDVVKRAGQVIHLDRDSVTFLTDEVIVRFKDQVDREQAVEFARRFGLSIERTIPYAGNAYLLKDQGAGTFDLLERTNRIAESEIVEYAHPNTVATTVLDGVPDDFRYPDQPHHAIVGAPAAWDETMGVNSIKIAVMDSGCDITHPDFQNPMGAGWTKITDPFDFVNYDSDPTNTTHGTKSCGIAAAVSDNAEGVAGMAGGCRLMPLRYPSGGSLTEYSDAYIWAAGFDPGSSTMGFPAVPATGADVISSSFGISEPSLPPVMKDTFDYLTSYGRGGKGCVVVFSVGNDNLDFTTYRQWAAYERTVAVASSRNSPPDPAEIKVTSSNFGSKVDVCAPGGGAGAPETRTMSTTDVGSGTHTGTGGGVSLDYATFGQTSCACPQVSGVAALMLSINPALTWIEAREILRQTAVKIDFGNADPVGQYVDTDLDGLPDYSQWYGFGRIDAAAAVIAARDWGMPQDLVVRENLADTGANPSGGAFWNSPDIWVRRLSPAVDGAAALPANYGTAGPHEQAKAGQDNWVWVRVKNTAGQPSLPFYVRVYLTHFAGTEFIYPDDFIPSNSPGVAPTLPLQTGTYLIGEVAHGPLTAGGEDNVNVKWPTALVPPQEVTVMGMDVTWHPCLLVEISPHDGLPASGNHVWDNNNLAQKNVSIDYTDDDDGQFASAIVLGNRKNRSRRIDLVIDRGRLPKTTRMWLRFFDRRVHEQVRRQFESRPAAPEGMLLSFPEESRVEISQPNDDQVLAITLPAGARVELGRRPVAVSGEPFQPGKHQGHDVILMPSQRRVTVPVSVPKGDLIGVIIGGTVPGDTPAGRYEVSITQLDEIKQVTGAASIEVRVGEKEDQQ